MFNLKKFKTLGELELPTKLALRSDIAKKLGETELSGLTINFKDSPLGIKEVGIELTKEDVMLNVITDFKLTTTENVIRNVYDHTVGVAKLFVEVR